MVGVYNPYLHYFDAQQLGEVVFTLTANNTDITHLVRDRYTRIELSDEPGIVADKIRIALDDRGHLFNLPPEHVKFTFTLGYEDAPLVPMGQYVVDEISYGFGPDTVELNALSADMLLSLKSQKKRAWKNTTLVKVLKAIATEHGLTPAISADFDGKEIDYLDQSYESDLHLITRLAAQYDAVAKPAGGSLVFVRQGLGKRADGSALPSVTISREQIASGGASFLMRKQFARVGAHWGNHRGKQISYVYAGAGEPVKYIRQAFKTERDAQSATEAELKRLKRGVSDINFTVVGNPILAAEYPIKLTDFREPLNGDWVIKQVTHQIDKPNGFVSHITARRPVGYAIGVLG